DEVAVLVDRRRRPVRVEDLALENFELPRDGAQRRRPARGRLGELPAESHEVALRLRLAEIEESVLRLGAPAVLRARLVEGADLEEGRLGQAADGGGLYVFEIARVKRTEVGLESVPGALPLGVQEVRVVPLVGGALADPGRGREVGSRRGEPMQGEEAAPVVEGLPGKGGQRLRDLLDLRPVLVGARIGLEEGGPAVDLGGERVAAGPRAAHRGGGREASREDRPGHSRRKETQLPHGDARTYGTC